MKIVYSIMVSAMFENHAYKLYAQIMPSTFLSADSSAFCISWSLWSKSQNAAKKQLECMKIALLIYNKLFLHVV